jgi:hypothetical protein
LPRAPAAPVPVRALLPLLLLAAACAAPPAPLTSNAAAGVFPPPARASTPIPPRAPGAIGGVAFIASLESLSRDARSAAIRRELLAGNIPSFLRSLRTITATAVTADGVVHTVAWQVMPDYLAVGSDDDFVRMPMDPHTAQAFCDAFDFVLPTRRMVNDIWTAADVKLEPRPLTEAREAPATFLQHHRIIEEQLAAHARGSFVAGIKKDVVVTGRLQERTGRVAIFGWHHLGGEPIQPLYVGHVDWYVDYSHGVRPVHRMMRVDGAPHTYESILRDETLAGLLSDEGTILLARYDEGPGAGGDPALPGFPGAGPRAAAALPLPQPRIAP